MADMLVNLLNLPDCSEDMERIKSEGINIRRIRAYERSLLSDFVLSTFHRGWADEVMSAFSHHPVSCFVATKNGRIIGFAAYECTVRNFFGPTGVEESFRGLGVGRVLLIECLKAMREMGYVYAIIGGVGPAGFYEKCCGAFEIPGSSPGIYTDALKGDED